MLVITRKIGERFLIGDNIWVTIVDIDNGRARIGITAPREISIKREEIVEKEKDNADN